MRRVGAVARLACAALFGPSLVAAQAPGDSARCDSILRTKDAVVDSARTPVFLSVEDVEGGPIADDQRDVITSAIARYFVAPVPFRLSVFTGPALAPGFRISSRDDSLGVPRSPSVVGTYRVEVSDRGPAGDPEVVRASLLRGLDSAMVAAIRMAGRTAYGLRPLYGDRWRLQVRLTGDSVYGSRRLAEGTFPRMRVRDASPISSGRPAFPDEARADSLDHGEVVLRFIVDRDGMAALETVELARSTETPFARAALRLLASQKFQPATIRGCPVAQLIEFPFIFDDRDHPPRAP